MGALLLILWVTGISPNYNEAKAIEAVRQIYQIEDAKVQLDKYKADNPPMPFLQKGNMTGVDLYVAARRLDDAGVFFEITEIPKSSEDVQPPAPIIEPSVYKAGDPSENLTAEERQKLILTMMGKGQFDAKFPENFKRSEDAKKIVGKIYTGRLSAAEPDFLKGLEGRIETEHPAVFIDLALGITASSKEITHAVNKANLYKQGKMLGEDLGARARDTARH